RSAPRGDPRRTPRGSPRRHPRSTAAFAPRAGVTMRLRTLPAAAGLAAGLAALAAGIGIAGPAHRPAPPPVAPHGRTPTSVAAPGSIEAAMAHLAQVPGDWPGWSSLGALELERGRATGDPAAYAAAQRAYDTSLRLQPQGNDEALAGRAALFAARHEFA